MMAVLQIPPPPAGQLRVSHSGTVDALLRELTHQLGARDVDPLLAIGIDADTLALWEQLPVDQHVRIAAELRSHGVFWSFDAAAFRRLVRQVATDLRRREDMEYLLLNGCSKKLLLTLFDALEPLVQELYTTHGRSTSGRPRAIPREVLPQVRLTWTELSRPRHDGAPDELSHRFRRLCQQYSDVQITALWAEIERLEDGR